MKPRLLTAILLFSMMFVLTHCAQKTAIQVLKPAEIDVGGIKRIAILDFRGPHGTGEKIASIFTSKLFATNFYTLVERSELQKVLEEHALNMSGIVDVETAVQAGNLLGVQGIIVGDVISYKSEDHRRLKKETRKVWTGEYEKDEKGNFIYEKTLFGKKVKKKKYKEKIVNVEVIEREATVGLSFRLIDVQTGSIIATRETSHSYKRSVKSGEGTLPPKQAILNRLAHQCIDDFVRMLAPHTVTIRTQFARGDDEVNRGIEFAKNDLWDKAQQVWEAVVRKDPTNHAAWYNLGLAFEALGDYESAERAYDRAVTLKQKKLYFKALKRIRQSIQDQQKLERQLNMQQEPESSGEMQYE